MRWRSAGSGFVVILAFIVAVVTPTTAAVDIPSDVHSSNVADVNLGPEPAQRGGPIHVEAQLDNATGVDSVLVTYCRIERYACSTPIAMDDTGDRTFRATIPWQAHFFEGVLNVGINIYVRYENGTREISPVVSWPEAPDTLPPDAHYYLYRLPPEAEATPGVGFLLGGLAAAMAVASQRRGRRTVRRGEAAGSGERPTTRPMRPRR